MQTRPNVFNQRGGDTIVVERLSHGLSARGHSVSIDITGAADPKNFDLVHLFNFATTGLTQQYAERAVAAGTPYVVTTLYEDMPSFHNQSHYVARKLFGYIDGGQTSGSWSMSVGELAQIPCSNRFQADLIARGAACLMSNGRGESDALRRDFPETAKIVEVPLGSELGAAADAELFERAFGIKDFVLCVGRLETRKNQLMLLKALEHSDLPVVLATGGFTYQPEYEAAIRAFRRKGKTILVGMLDQVMLSSAYAACRVHALPSWYELPGLVSLEAASRNKNIVVTRTGTTADYVGDTAFYCTPWDVDSILSAVTAAYYSPAREGLVQMAHRHTWEEAVGATERVYSEVVVGGARVAPQVRENVAWGNVAPAESNGENRMNRETPNFEDILERGESAAKLADFETADTLLAQAEQLNPTSTRVMKARGAVALARMNPEQAAVFFDRALGIESSDPKLLTGRGMCELLRGRYEEAIGFFQRSLQIAPDYLVALHQLLDCSYNLNRFDQALGSLNAYLAIRPDDLDIRFCLAGCLYKSGDSERAMRELERIQSVNAGHEGARDLMAIINARTSSAEIPATTVAQNETQRSLSELSERIRSWKVGSSVADTTEPVSGADMSSEVEVATEIARIEELKRVGNFQEAMMALAQLRTRPLSANFSEICECLEGEFTVLGGDLTGAAMKYDQILRANPNCARAWCGKGALAAEAAVWKSAEECFNRALASNSESDVAYAGMGICAMVVNDTERAFTNFQRATELNPENNRALLGLLQTGYPLKRYSEMERMLGAYLNLHPASLDILYSFAGVLFAQGKVNEARMEVEKILIFEPQHEHALELRGIIAQAQSERSLKNNQM